MLLFLISKEIFFIFFVILGVEKMTTEIPFGSYEYGSSFGV